MSEYSNNYSLFIIALLRRRGGKSARSRTGSTHNGARVPSGEEITGMGAQDSKHGSSTKLFFSCEQHTPLRRKRTLSFISYSIITFSESKRVAVGGEHVFYLTF